MHLTGEKVVKALQEMFPERNITGRERDYQNVLGIIAKHGERRFLFETPQHGNYRAAGYQLWVHRFAEMIRQKFEAAP